ncbi:Formimidoylglutamase [Rhodococcus sp. RD6.2]|jgi:formiminoglutamase|uniref:formimidoylglutamase n=1 Tax=Rhodococcus sp. RD6.2 TaxID=260936 RepID=UPI00063B7C44|nr:formimidoylglutamase [Rhodococcus sp. RD6.2]CRK52827.1 Formimidoylglutamase [Rhodococcus sp. RD6.2]
MSRVDLAPTAWSGRDDGPGDEHLRWHGAVAPLEGRTDSGAGVLIGFRSDEGVRRNKGRPGAADGPAALRAALASMSLAAPIRLFDAGDIEVADEDLEGGQARLGSAVTGLLDAGSLVTVLGGGHEVAYGSYLGIANSAAVASGARLGVLNLDAHFDLRSDARPSSGTPFRQMADRETAQGRALDYAVLGISQPSNTAALFATAAELGVRHLLDDDCANPAVVESFIEEFLGGVDLVYLTIDLDVLPAAVAPGVSAPAAFGVPLAVIQRVCDLVATSGKLALLDVAELNPALDVDNRTARTAARLIHRIVTTAIDHRA